MKTIDIHRFRRLYVFPTLIKFFSAVHRRVDTLANFDRVADKQDNWEDTILDDGVVEMMHLQFEHLIGEAKSFDPQFLMSQGNYPAKVGVSINGKRKEAAIGKGDEQGWYMLIGLLVYHSPYMAETQSTAVPSTLLCRCGYPRFWAHQETIHGVQSVWLCALNVASYNIMPIQQTSPWMQAFANCRKYCGIWLLIVWLQIVTHTQRDKYHKNSACSRNPKIPLLTTVLYEPKNCCISICACVFKLVYVNTRTLWPFSDSSNVLKNGTTTIALAIASLLINQSTRRSLLVAPSIALVACYHNLDGTHGCVR